ncbi:MULTISPECIES: hypothetical protein [unclassified Pseudoxanthomonas]|uniref:hypothetical protein n=1 Tax=unclassified Pseudoxanthomonas TaxID=2645906 RepID=UPI003077CA75
MDSKDDWSWPSRPSTASEFDGMMSHLDQHELNLKPDFAGWLLKFDRVQTQVNTLSFAPSGHKELKSS